MLYFSIPVLELPICTPESHHLYTLPQSPFHHLATQLLSGFKHRGNVVSVTIALKTRPFLLFRFRFLSPAGALAGWTSTLHVASVNSWLCPSPHLDRLPFPRRQGTALICIHYACPEMFGSHFSKVTSCSRTYLCFTKAAQTESSRTFQKSVTLGTVSVWLQF